MPAPDNLTQPAVRTAEAYALGVGRAELAGPRWRRPYRGVCLPSGTPADDPRQRVLEVAALVPPEGAITGWAAATLLGADELDGRGPGGRDRRPVPVVVPPPHQIRRRPGLRLMRSALDDADRILVDGVPVCRPARVAFDLARIASLVEGVVALDVLGRQIGLDLGEVAEYAAARPRWRGSSRVRAAVALADPRARSTGETRLRLFWTLEAGLPAPEVNPAVLDLDGHLIGIPDLLDPDAGLVGEYDGAGHRHERQHALDNAREEAFEAAGLIVVRVGAVDLRAARLRTRERLRAAHRRGMGRERRTDRWIWRRAGNPRPPCDVRQGKSAS